MIYGGRKSRLDDDEYEDYEIYKQNQKVKATRRIEDVSINIRYSSLKAIDKTKLLKLVIKNLREDLKKIK